jgi:pimeloyl-ACP methyl ester carboxylesterase
MAEAAISANDFEALDKLFLRPGIAAGHLTEEDRKAYRAAWSQPGAMTGNLNYYRASRIGPATTPGESPRGFDSDAPDKTVRVPTLVIWGEKDSTMVVENLNGLERYVPDLKVVRVPEGTHWIIHEMPDVITREAKAFLG